jgi:hypothetical protein
MDAPLIFNFFLLSFKLIISMLAIPFTLCYNRFVICCEPKYVMHAKELWSTNVDFVINEC